MSKKATLKLLIRSFGLHPIKVENYKADHGKKRAWRGKGIDTNNDVALDFDTKEGYKAAFQEIVHQGKVFDSKPVDAE